MGPIMVINVILVLALIVIFARSMVNWCKLFVWKEKISWLKNNGYEFVAEGPPKYGETKKHPYYEWTNAEIRKSITVEQVEEMNLREIINYLEGECDDDL